MKNKIVNVLYERGPMRQRVLADFLHVWQASAELIKALYELEKDGKIKRIPYSDPANMEYYNIWEYVKPA